MMSPTSGSTLENFLTPAECDEALKLFPKTETATTHKARVGLVSEGPESQALVTKIYRMVAQANRELYRFEIEGGERIQLAEYLAGDSYGWHLDYGPGAHTRRKLTAIVQLSPPGDYEGGLLELWNAPRPVSREQGTIVIFPSFLLHRVTPVTRGIRRSLTAWSVGEKPLR